MDGQPRMKMTTPHANLNGAFGNAALGIVGAGAALPSSPSRRVSPPVCDANYGVVDRKKKETSCRVSADQRERDSYQFQGIGGHQRFQFHGGARETPSTEMPPVASAAMAKKTSLSNVERILLAHRAIQGQPAAAATASSIEEASLLQARVRALEGHNNGSTAPGCQINSNSFQGRIERHRHQTVQGRAATSTTEAANLLPTRFCDLEGQNAAERTMLRMRARALEDELLLASSRSELLLASGRARAKVLEEELLLARSRTVEALEDELLLASNRARAKALEDELLLARSRTDEARTIEITAQRRRPTTATRGAAAVGHHRGTQASSPPKNRASDGGSSGLWALVSAATLSEAAATTMGDAVLAKKRHGLC